MAERVIIVGAGHAGTNAARTLREQGWQGEILLFTGEHASPYERPPLSKAILLGSKTAEQISLSPAGWFEANNVEFRSGTRVASIDRNAGAIYTSDGRLEAYDLLILATGASPFLPQIAGIDLNGVVTLRSLQQSNVLRDRMARGKRLVIIGGGLIGLEVAAAARTLGLETTVLEKAPALLSRIMPTSISSRIVELHRQHGTQIMLSADIQAIVGTGAVEGVRLSSGEFFAADTVLVAIGALPDVTLAEAAGLSVDRGILVNQYLQTSDPQIYAAGDIARYPSQDGTTRLECWKNALDQGAIVAANILGQRKPYRAVPWMWSDQFDKVAQVTGIPNASHVAVHRELANDGVMTFLLSPQGVLEAAAAFGDLSQVAKSVRVATSLIENGHSPSPELLADPASDLKAILKLGAANRPTGPLDAPNVSAAI